MTLELYHHDQSTCSQKVRICLAEKGVAWASTVLETAGIGRSAIADRGLGQPDIIQDERVLFIRHVTS